MITALRRLTLMTRLSMTAVLALGAMLLIVWQSLGALHDLLYADRQVKTRHLVEVAIGILDHYHTQQQAGHLDESQARQQALTALKRLRYEKTEYFWINDLGQPVPRMVMHPTVPALDGKVLDDAKFNKAFSQRAGREGQRIAVDGKNLFVSFNDVIREAGEGYVEYLWPKPLAGGGVSSELYTKLSYVKLYEPWDWVVGSGIYIDDVDRIFLAEARQSLWIAGGATVLLLFGVWVVRKSVISEFGGEPRIARGITRRIADGDLTGHIDLHRGDTDSVMFVLSLMQDNLQKMLLAICTHARRIRGSLEQMSAESREIEQATQSQHAAVAQARSAISTVTHNVGTVNGLVHATEEGAREVARQAREGAEVVAAVASQMQTIATMVDSSSAQLSRLLSSTSEIGQMARVIQEIADQTNLLALNAAIEAARAGQQGRGFAVVADEVRSLAQRTSKVTSEIGGILQEVLHDTESAVAGMQQAAPVIAGGVEQANSAAATLHTIEGKAGDTLSTMQDLSAATLDQSRGIEEITGHVDAVTHASTHTESMIIRSRESLRELQQASGDMFAMVKRFRIDADCQGNPVVPDSATGA